MSRGLGKLQRRILTALDDTPKETEINGWPYTLRDDICDLRALSKIMNFEGYNYEGLVLVNPSKQASFCRAVHSLIRRCHLIRVETVPLAGPILFKSDACRCDALDGDPHLHWRSRQVRFVKRVDPEKVLQNEDRHNAYRDRTYLDFDFEAGRPRY